MYFSSTISHYSLIFDQIGLYAIPQIPSLPLSTTQRKVSEEQGPRRLTEKSREEYLITKALRTTELEKPGCSPYELP